MRRVLCLLLISCLIFIAACSDPDGSAGVTGPEGDNFNEITVYLSEMVSGDSMPVTQKLSFQYVPEGIYFLSRLNEIVKDLGFNIRFETMPLEWPYATPDPDGIPYTYVKTLLEYAPRLAQGDVLMMFPTNNQTIGAFNMYLENRKNPIICPTTADQWQAYAPQWYEANKRFIDEDPYAIPVGSQNDMADYPVLLMQDEIAKKYDPPLVTLDDFEDFLYWCRAENPDKTPSLIARNSASAVGHYQEGYQDEILSLFACDLTGWPIDNALTASVGYTLNTSDGMEFRPVERDPGFTECIKRLLTWRDEGLIAIYDIRMPLIKDFSGYASAVLNTQYWKDTRLDFLTKAYGEAALELMERTPYILGSGLQPELRADWAPYPFYVSYFGINTTQEGIKEWLTFLEYLHANRENLRTLVWGEEGVEYTLDENGDYMPLPYPKPEDLDNPYDYDFRFDFHALQYFGDDRYASVGPTRWYPGIKWNKELDTSSIQKALDSLTMPEVPVLGILKKVSRVEQEAIRRSNKPETYDAVAAIGTRELDFAQFLSKLLKLPASEAEEYIEQFAKEQEARCRIISDFYVEWYGVGDFLHQLSQTETAGEPG